MLNPRASNCCHAAFVVGCNLCSIVFREVPASEPFKPFCANTANIVDVSSNERPTPLATAETCCKDIFISSTPVADAFAAPAKMFAASATLKLSSLNAFKTVAAISAADAKSNSPAVANESAPDNPPFITSLTERPAFKSSSCACAASNAEYFVSAPC
ncbi:hypothetical protein GPEKOOIF_03007 [Listeria monocytogenes]|nr:hypothetical protein GPEKOOIF_03007 [Listeria monocytogenes]